MNFKLIFKISVLVFALVLVVAGRRFFKSADFQKNANEIFAVEGKPFQWCSPERKTFMWIDTNLASRFKNQPPEAIAKKYCLILAESIQGVDLSTISWTPIAQSVDSEGQKVVLEWNKEKKLYRADGLPFKSSSLSREINP